MVKPTSPIRNATIFDDLVDILPFHASNLEQLQRELRVHEAGNTSTVHRVVPSVLESERKKKLSNSPNIVFEKKRKLSEVEGRVATVGKAVKRVHIEERRDQGPTQQPRLQFPSVLVHSPTAQPALAPSPIILSRPRVTSLALPSHNASPEPERQSRPFPVRFHSDTTSLQSIRRPSFALDEKLKRELIDGRPRQIPEQRREFAIDSMPPPRRPSLSHLPHLGPGRPGRSISGPIRMIARNESTAGDERRRASMNSPVMVPWSTTRVVVSRKSSISYAPPTPPHNETTFSSPQTTFSPRTEGLLERPLPLVLPAVQDKIPSFDYPSPTTSTSSAGPRFSNRTQSMNEHSFHHSYNPIHPPTSRRANSYPGTMARVRGLPLLNSPRFYFQLRREGREHIRQSSIIVLRFKVLVFIEKYGASL